MDEYYCPNCGATLNDQDGFDPDKGTWTCTSCGKLLMDDDVYDGDTYQGVAWFCDNCGALLNKQSGFSDSYGSWVCTECGHRNGTTEDDIIDEGPECPNCGASLNKQFCFADYQDDWECTECGAHLHHSYSSDPYTVVEEDDGPKCPNCDASLKGQSCYSEYNDDWECTECGAHLHHSYSSDPYELVDEDDVDSGDDSDSTAYVPPNYSSHSYSPPRSYSDDHIKYSEKPHIKKEKRKPENELRKQRIKAFFFKRKKINMSYDNCDLLGKDIDTVETLLYNQAFNNIKKIPIKDIYVNSSYRVGQVEQIVINGSSYFCEGDPIPYDAEIILTYHVKREIVLPFSEKSLRRMNYITAGDKLQDLGFTEIYERPIRDLVTGWLVKDGSVEKVTIGSVYPFKKNSVFTYDAKIVIEYHTYKKK